MKKSLMALTISGLLLIGCGQKDINVSKNIEKESKQEIKEQIVSSVYKENEHYIVLKNPIKKELKSGGTDFLIEYFWMGCPHCQDFEPILKSYLSLNKNVELVREHAALGDRWALDGRIYYALMETGNGEHFDDLFKLYEKIRKEQNKLPELEDLMKFLEEKKINKEEFFAYADSNEVLEQLKRGISEMMDNEITGVPSIVVKGKYLIPASLPKDIRSQENYNDLLNYLMKK